MCVCVSARVRLQIVYYTHSHVFFILCSPPKWSASAVWSSETRSFLSINERASAPLCARSFYSLVLSERARAWLSYRDRNVTISFVFFFLLLFYAPFSLSLWHFFFRSASSYKPRGGLVARAGRKNVTRNGYIACWSSLMARSEMKARRVSLSLSYIPCPSSRSLCIRSVILDTYVDLESIESEASWNTKRWEPLCAGKRVYSQQQRHRDLYSFFVFCNIQYHFTLCGDERFFVFIHQFFVYTYISS